jgi:hypothetical protein
LLILYSVQDGFHPNQYAMALEAAAVIEYATQNFPDVLGEENQYNDIITTQFGDQGGY